MANNLLQSNETQAVASGSGDRTVSLLELRTAAEQIPFSSYEGNVEQGQNVGQSIFGTSDSHTVQDISRPQSVGFNGGAASTSQLSNFNISQVVTSTTSVFTGSQQTVTYQTTPVTMPTVSVNSGASIPSFQHQTQTSQPTNMHGLPVIISETARMDLAKQGYQLPKLGDKQMLAIVNGQIYVVNDDTADPSTNAASTLASYNAPAPVIQNIGQQQVIVQHITPQQPSSEIEQQASQMPGCTTIVTQRNSMPIQNCSQGTFQMIQTAGSVTQTLGSLQHATGNSAPLSVPPAQIPAAQQQYLQQQQQQLLQRQQVEQLLQQIASAAGLDLNQPGVKQELLQQIIGFQGQQQTQSLSNTSQLFTSGSDLNDDDVEIDGDENPESNAQTTETEQRTKMFRGSSNIERDKIMQQKFVEKLLPQVCQGQIPTFVMEDISVNEDQRNDLVSCQNQDNKQIKKTFHDESFEHFSSSEGEDDA